MEKVRSLDESNGAVAILDDFVHLLPVTALSPKSPALLEQKNEDASLSLAVLRKRTKYGFIPDIQNLLERTLRVRTLLVTTTVVHLNVVHTQCFERYNLINLVVMTKKCIFSQKYYFFK